MFWVSVTLCGKWDLRSLDQGSNAPGTGNIFNHWTPGKSLMMFENTGSHAQ